MDRMQLCKNLERRLRSSRFNTASGMDCMQWEIKMNSVILVGVSIPQAVWIACNENAHMAAHAAVSFQYRKRYGLHAIQNLLTMPLRKPCFNTASGMDCMQYAITYVKIQQFKFQYRKRYGLHAMLPWTKGLLNNILFQYRKRYGLHAILSPRTLENSEPKRWFSSTPSLFAPFPKPQGIFLSQKAVQKGCKASNIKETFVHEENLKLMTSFRKSRTSL